MQTELFQDSNSDSYIWEISEINSAIRKKLETQALLESGSEGRSQTSSLIPVTSLFPAQRFKFTIESRPLQKRCKSH